MYKYTFKVLLLSILIALRGANADSVDITEVVKPITTAA